MSRNEKAMAQRFNGFKVSGSYSSSETQSWGNIWEIMLFLGFYISVHTQPNYILDEREEECVKIYPNPFLFDSFS